MGLNFASTSFLHDRVSDLFASLLLSQATDCLARNTPVIEIIPRAKSEVFRTVFSVSDFLETTDRKVGFLL